jgi:hypothetical protein
MRLKIALERSIRQREEILSPRHPISTRINSVANDDEECCAPVALAQIAPLPTRLRHSLRRVSERQQPQRQRKNVTVIRTPLTTATRSCALIRYMSLELQNTGYFRRATRHAGAIPTGQIRT